MDELPESTATNVLSQTNAIRSKPFIQWFAVNPKGLLQTPQQSSTVLQAAVKSRRIRVPNSPWPTACNGSNVINYGDCNKNWQHSRKSPVGPRNILPKKTNFLFAQKQRFCQIFLPKCVFIQLLKLFLTPFASAFALQIVTISVYHCVKLYNR